MKILVAYYSKTGNNRLLAERFARSLKCDIEEIRPRMNALFFQIFFSSLPKFDSKRISVLGITFILCQ